MSWDESTGTSPGTMASGVTTERLADLRRWNLGLTVLHALQAVVILLLASDFAIAVTSTFPEGPPGTRPPRPDSLFDVRIGVAVAVFLGLAAIDHLVTATIARRTYEDDLRRGINRFRWVEYSCSATLMVLLIASYTGITDITAVIAIARANVGMILFGWIQERGQPAGALFHDHGPVLVRRSRRGRSVDRDRGEHDRRRRGSGVRLRHLRRPGPLLLQLRLAQLPDDEDRTLQAVDELSGGELAENTLRTEAGE